MDIKHMEANLYCIRCRDEVEHRITYINEKMSCVKCLECGNTLEFNIDVSREYYKEMYLRITTKPERITKEYRENLSQFLFSLPVRVMSKPYRLFKDIHTSKNVIKAYKRNKKTD